MMTTVRVFSFSALDVYIVLICATAKRKCGLHGPQAGQKRPVANPEGRRQIFEPRLRQGRVSKPSASKPMNQRITSSISSFVECSCPDLV